MALAIRPADIIKARVIDFLIEKFDGVVIGDEVMYGSSRRIVDLLALYNGDTYAVEIKSSKDDLRRFKEQIIEYSKIFDYTLVFTTIEHVSRIKEIAQSRVSIFIVRSDERIEGEFLEKRNGIIKREMLATMNSSYIRRRLNIVNAVDSDSIRRRAMWCKKEVIRSLLYDYFMEKCLIPYNIFLDERGNSTEIDDLVVLSNRLNVE